MRGPERPPHLVPRPAGKQEQVRGELRYTRRRALLLILVAITIAVSAWHYGTLYRDATGAKSALLALEQHVGEAGLQSDVSDLEAAERGLEDARERIGRARAHLRWDPLLNAARWLPLAGDQVDGADGLLEIAGMLVEMGHETSMLARRAMEVATAREDRETLPATAVLLLDEWEPSMERLRVLADRAVARRLEMGDEQLVGPLDEARRRVDRRLPQIAAGVGQAAAASRLLPGLLGFEGERRYLLLSLNNAELMPGGGLVSVAGVVAVQDGRVVSTEFRDSRSWIPEWTAKQGEYITPPGPLKRYLLKDYSWNIGVSNWDPDFPTSASHALEFYEMAWGPQDVDGVVAVDLEVLRALLDVTGPKTVDAPGFGRIRLTSENAFLRLEEVTRPPSGTWVRSKSVVGELQNALLHDVLSLPPRKWSSLAEAIRQVAGERHLQVLLFDSEAQAVVQRLGWDGSLRAPSGGDYLQFNEASVNSTKLNKVFAPEATYRIEVTELGTARHELRLRYHNTVREWAVGRDPALVSHLMFDGQYGGYLRTFLPLNAVAFSAMTDGRVLGVDEQRETARHRWFGVYVPVPPGARREVTLSWSVPSATDDSSTYLLLIQKQAGTAGLCMDLTVHRRSIAAASLEIEGGTRKPDGRTCLTSDVTVRARFRS